MSRYDDQLQQLRDNAERARIAMDDLADDAWADADGRERTLAVIAYAETVLAASNPALISDPMAAAVSNALAQMETNPAAAATSYLDPWCSALLDAVGLLPVARGRDLEQAVTEAATTFQRSAGQRLRAVSAATDKTQEQVAAVREEIATASAELATTIEECKAEVETEVLAHQTAFEAKLAEYEARRSTEESALTGLREEQTAAFEKSEAERKAAVTERVEQADGDFAGLLASAEADVAERVEEIRRMERESAQLVGAIGLAGTAERYGEEVVDQKKIADLWRWITLALALAAVAGAVYALSGGDATTETFTGKLALSVVFGGIAAYAARQSSYHRGREQRARDLQLELTAFSPFIEPLSPEQQEEERVVMTRKTFGKTTATQAHEEDPGPAPISALLRRRDREPEA